MKHRTDCRCPNCDPEMASVMRMNSQQYSGWLNLTQGRRPRASGRREFRTVAARLNAHPKAPKPYSLALAKLHRETALCASEGVIRSKNGTPLPYTTAVVERRKQAIR